MIKDGILTIKNDKGIEKDFNILFTFESKETLKTYVIYTNYEKDENNNLIIYSGCYDKEDSKLKIEEVTTQNELDIIENLLKNLKYDAK